MITSNGRLFEALLVDRMLVDQAQLAMIKQSSEIKTKTLFGCLLNLKTIQTDELYLAASKIWAVPYIDIKQHNYRIDDDSGIPRYMLRKLKCISLIDQDNKAVLAIGEPEHLSDVHKIVFFAKREFTTVLADIHEIDKLQNQQTQKITKLSSGESKSHELDTYLLKADNLGASDIHIESFNGYCRLRIRVDGILHPLESISTNRGRRLISQIKLLADMDIAQSRLPQDGRLSYALARRSIALRVNSIPTVHGEKLVLRLLAHYGKRYKLDKIGLLPAQFKKVRQIIKQPNGLILVSGPTGSGKTVSLYALLELLNTGKENICTIEDPVEIFEDGINQVNINRKAGLDFSQALRALLRQDPDILMVGEIRDAETAEISVKAAQTGHLVMATLHSRCTLSAKQRLLQLGVKNHVLDDALKLIIAQRLPRQLCVNCRQKITTPQSLQSLFKANGFAFVESVYKSNGCNTCLQGYSGRRGIFEVFNPDLDEEISRQQRQINYSLAESGLQQILKGMTSYNELLRVL